jgi:hypothetical protein
MYPAALHLIVPLTSLRMQIVMMRPTLMTSAVPSMEVMCVPELFHVMQVSTFPLDDPKVHA